MDYILNIKQESENIDIQNQPSVNIDIQEESIAINKISDNISLNIEQAPNIDLNIEETPEYILNFDGPIVEIDGNYAEAMQAVQLAKDWATKTDGTVDGVDYSSKYYAQQIIPLASDITTVSGIASDITTVSGIASDISTVSGIASDISSVAGDLTNIDAVASNETNINSVANNETNINIVAGISSDISSVASNASDISAVAGDLSNIDSVAGDLTNIDAVNSNKTNIDTVAGISSDINTIAGISSDITSVAGNNSNITAVANNETDISAVASDLTNINAVAGDLTNIDNASSYAAEAKQWAIGDPTEPAGNSAKYWADEAATTLANKQDKLTVGNGIDITSNIISVTAPTLTNTAVGTNSLAILGTINSAGAATSIGVDSTAGSNGTSLGKSANSGNGGLALGTFSKANGSWATAIGNGNQDSNSASATASGSIAIGHNAHASASGSIQIGEGTNSTANSLQINSYELLDTSTGLIPDARINSSTYTTKTYVDNADNSLQSQIDAITASSDVTDIVGTYAELQAYDTSSLAPNSIIKVLQDENQNDETTYYRWVISGGVGSWVLIGEEGPYYTKSETNTLLAAKANDSDAVHKTGNETIAGDKTFSNPATFNSTTTFTTGATNFNNGGYRMWRYKMATGNTYEDVSFYDDSGTFLGSFRIDNTGKAEFITFTSVNAPTPATSDNSTKIATTAFVKAQNYITGINSSDITTALGYTPVDPSNLATVATSGSYSDLSGTPTVDQIYDATSSNAQSGVAVASAIAGLGISVDQIYDATSTNAQSGTAVAGAIADMATTNTAQTISNTKTFTSAPIINARPLIWQSETIKGTPPASTEYTAINFVESGDTSGDASKRLGNLEFYVQADGENKAVLRAYQNTASSTDNAQIWVGRKSDGTNETYAPTPAAASNTTNIATTAWVKSFANTSGANYMTTFSKGGNGYFKFTNGLIIQWGNSANASSPRTVTFPTAFTSTNYRFVFNFRGTSGELYAGAIDSKTTTGCKIRTVGGATADSADWVAIGY